VGDMKPSQWNCPACGHEMVTSGVDMDAFERVCMERDGLQDELAKERNVTRRALLMLKAANWHEGVCAIALLQENVAAEQRQLAALFDSLREIALGFTAKRGLSAEWYAQEVLQLLEDL
jgi:isopentenyldiphosphate isomerase